MGGLYEKLGDFESAKAAFIKAKDSDALPLRAKSSLNELIRQLAEKHGLMFVDLVQILEPISPHGIIGSDLIYDNVHPTVQAQQLIADEISRALAAHGKMAPAEAWQWQALESAREDKENEEWKVEGSMNAHYYVLRGLTLWGQKRYAEAVPDLEKGLELMPKFIESYGFLGDAYWHLGQTQKAVDLFRKLAQEDPGLFKTLLTKYPEIGQSYTESSRHPSSGSIAVHP
jgi:tetratricopeptide (TPR) repeat protein